MNSEMHVVLRQKRHILPKRDVSHILALEDSKNGETRGTILVLPAMGGRP